MTRFKLIPYSVRIRKKRSKDYLRLDNIGGNDLHQMILKAVEDLKDTKVDEKSNKTVSTERYQIRNREIMGILRIGDYGIGAHFFNVIKRKLIPDARTTNDSEVLPFFFHFYLPQNKDIGILILQTFQHHAIKGIFTMKLRDRKEFSKYMLEFKRIVSGKALKALMEGDLLSITFVRHSIPKDVGSQLGKTGRTDIEEVRTFKVKGDFQISDRLLDLFANTETKYYEVSDEKYDEAKAVVKIGKSEVVLVFSEGNIFNEFNALDDYDQLVDGFPEFEYMIGKSSSYLADLEDLTEG